MKVDYKNYPILEKLEKGMLGNLPVNEDDVPFFFNMKERFYSEWKESNNSFKSEINVITKPFQDAANKSKDKLLELFQSILLDDLLDFEIKGTYVVGNFVFMIDFKAAAHEEKLNQYFYIFSKEGIPLSVWNITKNMGEILWASQSLRGVIDMENLTKWAFRTIAEIILFKMFKSYAVVETKFLKSKQKVRDAYCPYRNNTKLDLTFLDCKWFTNLVKSDGFNVRGHFRLQPKKKDGKWTKELIWISGFQKTGYTAPARILAQN